MYIYISVLTLGASFWRTSCFQKKYVQTHPTCPFFRIQNSTFNSWGEKFNTTSQLHPPMAAGSNLRLAAMQKGQGLLPTPTTLKRCHGTAEAYRVLDLTKSRRTAMGFQHENQYSITSGVYHVILHLYMHIYMHACIIYVYTLYIYIIHFYICSDIFLQPSKLTKILPELRGPRPPCPQALPTRPRLSANHRNSDLSLPKRCCNLRDPSKRDTDTRRWTRGLKPRVDTLRIPWGCSWWLFFLGGGCLLSWFIMI